MCMIDHAEPCDFYDRTWRKARKEHQCEECYRRILPGERYLRHAMKYAGEVSTFIMCAHCDAAASWLTKHCGGYMSAGVLDDLEEHWGESYDEDRFFLGRAIIGMRRKWRRKNGTLLPVLRSLNALQAETDRG